MSETVLYRKYRPQSFSEVLGQDHVTDVIKGAIKGGKVAHAYLFSGTRGTGKTSVARILAKEIGTSPNDLYEIDAASNRGIDDIRELREAVNTLPFESKKKVYIIDEVHMLTKEAFNALLKTLEEPPSHVIFVLATTEAHKLPDTVISRCQVFHFRKPGQKVLREFVLNIAKKEGYKLDNSSAELISILGDGSFRDALGILQKVTSVSKDKKISEKEVERAAGAPSSKMVNDFIEGLAKARAGKALSAISKASEANMDMKIFMRLVLHKVRAVLFFRYASDMEKALKEEFSSEDYKFLKDLSGDRSGINSNTLLELLDVYSRIGYSAIPELPVELAVIKLAGDEKGQTK